MAPKVAQNSYKGMPRERTRSKINTFLLLEEKKKNMKMCVYNRFLFCPNSKSTIHWRNLHPRKPRSAGGRRSLESVLEAEKKKKKERKKEKKAVLKTPQFSFPPP